MEGITNSSNEMEIPKTETCEVFEAGVCAMPCNDGSSEIFNLEKNPESMEDQNQNHQPAQEPIISDEIIAIPSEISSNLCVEQNVSPEPIKPPMEPVNMENTNFIDFNQMQVQKPNPTSNKRKSDNHADSNIEEKKNYNMRKNLRGVIDENNFDTITKAAQQEEAERLARVQGLKKSVKHKFSHPSLEAMLEDLPFEGELQCTKSMISCERQDIQLQNKTQNLDLNEVKFQRIDDKKVDKKVWSQWLGSEGTTAPLEDNGEVVTIDSSSDDDCIILSDSEESMDDEEDDDQHNSGLHVSDTRNIPNEHGKVLVNVGHVESEPDIFVAPQIAKIIKPHQIGGVRFLFDNIIESTKRFNNSSGFGCILAHSMGLGKTLQVVCFCDIFLRHTDAKTILCVMPINTIQNWLREFNMWLPKETHNPEVVRPRHFNVFALDDQQKTLSSRSNVILRWAAEGGVLLIGYELFRVLALKIVKKREGKRQESAEHKRLLDRVHMALVKPGPDLVICDEGHRIKNAHAGISVALKQIRSRRRIVLTGYPLQNNLLEYWCMVDFVRPNYLGTKTEFCNMFERPIQNGQCIDSTPEDIKLMRYRAHVLHSLLVGFVQRRSDSVLQNSLPQKMEYVILTKMTKFQRDLYDAFMNEVVRKKKVPNPLKAFAVCCKIWNHPDVLYRFLKKKESDFDLDIEEQCTPQETAAKALAESSKLNKTNSDCGTFPSDESAQKDYVQTLDNSLSSEPFYTNNADPKCFFPNPMMGTPTKENPPTFWQDGVSTVEAQQPKPDYVGLMAKPGSESSSEEQLKCPSQIVDLDTKEVQFIKSDISTDLDVGTLPGNAKPNSTDVPSSSAFPKIMKPEPKGGNDTISYDWALSLIKTYEPGLVSTSPKMQVLLCILEESVKVGDRVLVFSQSLLTLNLIEFFLQNTQVPDSQCNWKKNVSYFRLDGSTTSMEREKLVIEFNSNTDVKLFLISTRAGSLGINLTGANRVVVFDASWNPCHDTQAVHRIYRYGQKKSCFVYRIVMDNCLEKNIYDRQVKKQGMSDRVVDECNPDAHLSIRELTNLCYDKEEENQSTEFKEPLENYSDAVIRKILTDYKNVLSKEPFYHESLLIDRKDKKLSQSEKRMAKRGYEIEKKASTKPTFLPNNIVIQNRDCIQNHIMPQPIRKKFIKEPIKNPGIKFTRWIPAEVWQRQGMSSQEMMLPIDVAIPTNSTETSNIVVKAGEKVMVLKSPKGVYMQLESGKIIAIKTSAEAAADRLKAKGKINCVDMQSKKPFNMLSSLAFKNDHARAPVDRAIADDKDDVIVISDSINDDAEPTFDQTSTSKTKSRIEINTTKPDIVIPQIYPNRKDVISTELRNDKPETLTIKPQTHTQPQPQSLPQTLPQPQPQQPQPQSQAQPQPQHQHQHQPQHQPQHQHQHQHQHQQQPQPQESQFEQQNMYEHPPRSNYPEKHQHRNNFYGNMTSNSNYESYPQHNMKGLHLQAHPTPAQRWENKSPDVFKQTPLKISNIPAPYPSTAISDMNAFEKNEKAQQPPVNDITNVDQYAPASSSSYTPQTCKESEEHSFHHSLNHPTSTNYYSNTMPTTSTDDTGSYNPLYHFNNKQETNYSENLYDNTETAHSNYHHSYGYYPPQYLPNFSNKVYDNNAYSSVSSQYYIRRPPPFSTNSTNGVDLGFNFTEPQGWTKKHLPD